MTVLDKIKEATAEYDKAKVALDDTDVGDGSGFAVVVRYGNAHADLCRLMFSALPHLIAVAEWVRDYAEAMDNGEEIALTKADYAALAELTKGAGDER